MLQQETAEESDGNAVAKVVRKQRSHENNSMAKQIVAARSNGNGSKHETATNKGSRAEMNVSSAVKMMVNE